MEKIMELIKKKGIDKGIQDAINKSYALTGGNISQDDITEAVKNIIRLEIIEIMTFQMRYLMPCLTRWLMKLQLN